MYHDRRLIDERQPLLHPIVERGSGGGAQLLHVVADAVPGGERDQGDRLTRGLAESRKDLPASGAPRGVDRRA